MNAPREPQPWHAADEKPRRGSGTPIGTHSLTGGGAAVGVPEPPHGRDAERSAPREQRPLQQPDPLAEPRAGTADGAGRKP